jgi:hypothetical protein
MSAAPRDLLKSPNARTGEVFALLHLGAGQANGQLVTPNSCLITADATHNYNIAVGAGTIVLGGVAYAVSALTAQTVAAGATTSTSQFLKVLLELDTSGALHQTVGAIVTTQQSDAVLPKGNPAYISIGWLAIPASFTPGTTSIATAGIINQMAYYGTAGSLTGL